MDLVGENGDYERRRIEEEKDDLEGEKPQATLLTSGGGNNNGNGDGEIPPKPEDWEEPSTTLEEESENVEHPTDAPRTQPPAEQKTPPPVAPALPYPETNATLTDLAKQEVGNFMAGGVQLAPEEGIPPPPEDHEEDSAYPPKEEPSITDLAHQELGNLAGDGEEPTAEEETTKDSDYDEPSEMGIVVPTTEEEEEEIDEEIEEWEEEHGKPKPGETTSAEDETAKETQAPTTSGTTSGTSSGTSSGTLTATGSGSSTLSSAKDQDEEITLGGSPTVNPLVVSGPSWTPPKVEGKHTLAPRDHVPTMAPVPVPTMAPVPVPTAVQTPRDFDPNTEVLLDRCKQYTTQKAYILCKYNIPPMAATAVPLVILLLLLCCCYRCCCSKSTKKDTGRGEYRQIANTYGDASFDNAFSEDISDDEEDLEDASWGESNGRTVLEMRNLGRGKGDGLSLEEMNG